MSADEPTLRERLVGQVAEWDAKPQHMLSVEELNARVTLRILIEILERVEALENRDE